MKLKNYHLEGEEKIISPAMIYYRDAIVENTKRTIELAGSVDRLWYHVKTHKCRELVTMQRQMGYVNAEQGFQLHSKLADFATEYLCGELGEEGVAARAALGVASLPGEAPVEIQIICAAG